jgi:hypothetical protein
MLSFIMLNVANNPFMMSVVMLNVVMLNVVAPKKVLMFPQQLSGKSKLL